MKKKLLIKSSLLIVSFLFSPYLLAVDETNPCHIKTNKSLEERIKQIRTEANEEEKLPLSDSALGSGKCYLEMLDDSGEVVETHQLEVTSDSNYGKLIELPKRTMSRCVVSTGGRRDVEESNSRPVLWAGLYKNFEGKETLVLDIENLKILVPYFGRFWHGPFEKFVFENVNFYDGVEFKSQQPLGRGGENWLRLKCPE